MSLSEMARSISGRGSGADVGGDGSDVGGTAVLGGEEFLRMPAMEG